ncbi:MAG: selenocysteine-specific translation elongation factor [bacterium]|nr:selenocysteine-specific translation elongation factor [bacterium]
MKSIIIGTAGHVDHGKTRLIGRLTGINTDRLKEEQQRGISIELGFARLELDGVEAGIIDVPGHEKFVRTMVAGAGGMDMALLVVAADEGVMPQTREHVEVLELLGIDRVLVALTKIDMVDEEMVELAADDVQEYLSDTIMSAAEVIPCSSETGEGLEQLRVKLAAMAVATPERTSVGTYRLPIDRVFTMTGMGTVVTGTSWSGSVRVGDQLELQPQGRQVRVRGIQVHEHTAEVAHAGQRTALALHGVKHDELTRGELLVTEGRFQSSSMISLKVRALSSSPWTLKQRSRIRFHFGTQEVLGRLILLDKESLPAGEEALAQARLEEPTVCAPGDRVILRFYSPMQTIAGGEVLEAVAPKRRHGRDTDLEAVRLKESGDPALILERAILDAGLAGAPEKELKVLMEKYEGDSPLPQLAENRVVVQLGKRLFHTDLIEALATEIEIRAHKHHEERPLAWGPAREGLRSALASELPQASFQKMLEHLETAGRLRLKADLVRASEEPPGATGQAAEWLKQAETAWLQAGLTAPKISYLTELGVPEDMVTDLANLMVARELLIRITPELLVHRDAFARFREGLVELFGQQEVLVVGQIGQHFELSRKFSVPLLEYCDQQGLTERREAERRRGPEL